MKTINFAIIGFGNIGKRYEKLLAANEHATVVALVDIEPLASPLGNISFFSSLNDLINNEVFNQVDIVVIATPNNLHATQAIQCLHAGKHVIVEKPMALLYNDALQISEAAARANKEVFVVMQNRYNPLLQWLRQVSNNHVLGDIYLVKVNCYWNRDERYYQPGNWHGTQEKDGGTLYTQFSHFLDAVYWIFGKMEVVHASFANLSHQHLIDFEDTGFIQLKFGNSICTFDYSTAVYNQNYEGSITVFAQNGTVKIGGTYMDKLEYASIKEYEMPMLEAVASNNNYGSIKGSASYHGTMLQNIIEHLNNRKPYINTPQEGSELIKLMEEIYQFKK